MSIFDIAYSVLIMPIQLIFETFFMLAYREIGNAGVSIIVLSLAMNFLVLPLYMRADKMQERERDIEAKLHDGVAHIRKTFKGDEKMMMLQAYYRQNGYKPTDVLKSSVSLFLEIPFFIAAYAYLSHLQLLQGVPFWFIHNLGAPDGLLVLGGVHINVLPFVMTAINLGTCLLFTRGMSRKSQIQLYAMAAIFLVLLYDSPAGLVFYWTLNNVFSFVKTLFYKLKNPKIVLAALAAILGVFIGAFGILFIRGDVLKEGIVLLVVGIILCIPLVVMVVRRKGNGEAEHGLLSKLPANKKLYIAGAVFLTVLFGVLIPSAVIGASPQEFVSVTYYLNPAWYIVSSLCLAAGTFLVWMGVFYWLTSPRYKPVFQIVVVMACGVALVDYMFFGTNLGLIESNLQYQDGLVFTNTEELINGAVVLVVGVVLGLLAFWLPKKLPVVLAVACVAMVGMGAYNLYGIEQAMPEVQEQAEQYQASEPSFPLNKDGKNVVILMLDRAMNEYIPFIFNEFPELKEEFSGFTYYDNVISFGGYTNYGSPALFGGYEYTPAEINKRSDELLVEKHNEALKVLPVLFAENGYEVTFCDPTYAGYQWVPDLSIFDEYEGIDTYITSGRFTAEEDERLLVDANKRNFFYFGLMKALPLVAQPVLYDDGSYNRAASRSESVSQTVSKDAMTATGQVKSFLDSYAVLQNLDVMTEVSATTENPGSLVILTNNATHDTMILQEPEYVPQAEIDNTEYERTNHSRFTLDDGNTLIMETPEQYRHYHANVAVLKALGVWFNYLKQQGVYDNTRIILVADHGRELGNQPGTYERFYPLLMVKEFDATGFTTSSEFMTNGDVPVLATQGLIRNPVNPFTGKAITDSEKFAHPQYVADVADEKDNWSVARNNGTTFVPGSWLSVHTDRRDPNNWKEIPDPNL